MSVPKFGRNCPLQQCLLWVHTWAQGAGEQKELAIQVFKLWVQRSSRCASGGRRKSTDPFQQRSYALETRISLQEGVFGRWEALLAGNQVHCFSYPPYFVTSKPRCLLPAANTSRVLKERTCGWHAPTRTQRLAVYFFSANIR